MDPLSTTITVATFLVGIIKLAEEIKQSLEKVPKNRKNLRRLSEDVLRGLLELGKFYDERGHVLDGSTEVQAALDHLSSNIRSVYTRCCAKSSFKAHGPFDKAMAGFKAWYRSKEIEAEIEGLRDEVQGCYIRFTAFAIARLDKPVTKIAMSTSRIENTILLLDQHHRAGLSRIEGVVANLQGDAHSTRVTTTDVDTEALTKSPRETENLYLHQQVQTVAGSFGRIMSRTMVLQERPNGPYKYPLAPIIISHDSSHSAYHRHTVSVALRILRVLDDEPSQLLVQIGAWNMVNLAIRLHSLEMYSDAVIMGTWTVSLYRILVATDAAVFEPYLALALHNLSRYHVDIGDDDKAEIALGESIKLLRELVRTRSQTNFRLLLSNSLMALWSILTRSNGNEQGLTTVHESLAILEAVRGDLKQGPLLIMGSSHALRLPVTSQSPHGVGSALEVASQTNIPPHLDNHSVIWLDFDTARASFGMSCSLYDLGRYPEALEMGEKSFGILSSLAHQHPGIFDATLAGCLAHLSQPYIGVDRSVEDTLCFSEKAVQIYRQLYLTRPKKFTKPFIMTLWEYAILMHETGNCKASKRIAEEAVGIVRRSEKDPKLLAEALHHSSRHLQHLNFHERAVDLEKEVVAIYRELVADPDGKNVLADRMCCLSSGLYLADQLDEAIMVCREAIEIYRSVASHNGGKFEKADLALGLSHLTHLTNMAKEYDLALVAGTESLELYRELTLDDSNLAQHFLVALQRTSFATCYSDNPQALTRSAEIISDHKALEARHTQLDARWGLANALKNRDFILGKYRLIHEALLNSEQLVKTVKNIPVDNVEAAITLINGLSVHVENLTHVGRVKEAIMLCEKGILQAREIQADSADRDLDLALADILHQYSQCLCTFGRNSEALAATEEIIALHRRHPNEDEVYGLREHSINLRNAKRYMEAVEFGKEAVKCCHQLKSATVLADFQLPYALESLSTCLAETGDEDQALVTVGEAVEFYRKSMSNGYVAGTWAYVEVLYADALVNLACRSMMREDWNVAETALLEAKSIYQSRAVVAPGHYPNLAIALDLTALLLRAVGRSEESVLVMQDLTERQHHLEALYPEVAILAQMALDDLKTAPSQLALRQKIYRSGNFI